MGFKHTNTSSSDGLSAQLLDSPSDFMGDEVGTIDFFLDLNLLPLLNGIDLEEANSHLMMFEVTENDPPLRRATLLDGRLINFLFINSITKAVRAKRYLRCLHEEQQDLAVKFYHKVCSATMEYHSSLRGYGLCKCCVTSSAKEILEERLANAFTEFIAELALHQSTGLIDDI